MITTYPTQQLQKESANYYQKNLPKPKLKEVVLDKRIKLSIPKKVSHQIRYLCNEISELEWSGILMYKLVGNFHTGNFHCAVKDIFPMNVGSSVYTEYEFNEDFIKYRMDNPESLDWEVSHVHSHNKMETFFSGTDMQELHDNSGNHNYYLSLIVNNAFEPTAKISFVGKQQRKEESTRSFFGDNGKLYTFKENKNIEEDVLFIYDCSIEYDLDIKVNSDFKGRVSNIISAKKELNKKKPINYAKSYDNQMEIPYSEFNFPETISNSSTDLDDQTIESMLIVSLENDVESKSTDIEEVLFKFNQDYKVKGEKLITAFGNQFRSYLPIFLSNNRFELTEDEAINVVETLLFYGENDFEELVNKLCVEILE